MDDDTKRAYRLVLASALLHLKWDLASCLNRVKWYRPRRALAQLRNAQLASRRAIVFHNLAIFSSRNFDGFSEQTFWNEVSRFQQLNPDTLCPYRSIFEKCLHGENVDIVCPSGSPSPIMAASQH